MNVLKTQELYSLQRNNFLYVSCNYSSEVQQYKRETSSQLALEHLLQGKAGGGGPTSEASGTRNSARPRDLSRDRPQSRQPLPQPAARFCTSDS